MLVPVLTYQLPQVRHENENCVLAQAKFDLSKITIHPLFPGHTLYSRSEVSVRPGFLKNR